MDKLKKQIVLNGLTKISLNKWYAGNHWTARAKIKEAYSFIIKNQIKDTFSKLNKYNVEYTFEFKNKPLDASNCVAMVKLIEDCLFEDDNYKIIESIKIKSIKSNIDRVIILINN